MALGCMVIHVVGNTWPMDTNEKMEDLKGRAKEAAGDLTDRDDLQREGKVDQASAKVKDKVGDVADKVKGVVGKD